MSLYKITVEYTIMIEAETERDAELDVERFVGEDGTNPDLSHAVEVKTVKQVPKDWVDAIPFGGDTKDDRTCKERLTEHSKPLGIQKTEKP